MPCRFGIHTRLASALGAAVTLGACDTPPPASPTEPVEQARAHNVDTPPATAAAAPPVAVAKSAAPLQVGLHEVRRTGPLVEIEVVLDRPLPPLSGVRPSLQIGDEVARRSRAGADGRLDRLVFTVDAEQFDRMPQDGEIIVHAGVFSNAALPTKARLSDVATTIVGGTP